ncbi:PDZ domain-containing protein [candidate division GN15 bacterium]|nr:PDZ domain-containing protein [candidate division GN15 bacterium]
MTQSAFAARRDIILSAIFMMLLILLAGGMGIYVLAEPNLKHANTIATVAAQLHNIYGENFDWPQAIESARAEMLANLDRYSGYIEGSRFEQLDEEFTGGYGGIGVSVVPHDDGLLIMTVREGGPAAKVGLLTGDIVIKADGQSLADLTIDRASRLLRGEPDSEVDITVFRPAGDDTISVTATRARIDLLHIPFAGFTPDSAIYIRLLDFQSGATDDLEAALDSLLEQRADPPGIVLDLRGNPGGLFSEAYRTASLFLQSGQFIVGTDGRSRWEEESYYSSGDDITDGLPLVILIDNGTASSAEIVSGALGQLERATLAGDTTFGKGLVQGFSRFSDGSGLRLTISRYYLADSLYLNEFDSTLNDTGHGIPPDVPIEFIDRQEFPRAIERSLLLQEFAHLHEDAIISHPGQFALDRSWAEDFADYAREQDFDFTSERTEAAREMLDIAQLENASARTVETAERLVATSAAQDERAFATYAGYITSRLKQIAYERRFGAYRMYRDVIVRERPEIRTAVELLRGGRP